MEPPHQQKEEISLIFLLSEEKEKKEKETPGVSPPKLRSDLTGQSW